MGALSIEAAARCLNAREIDGLVIGDGSAAGAVEAFLTRAGRGRALPRSADRRARRAPSMPRQLPNFVRAPRSAGCCSRASLPLIRLHAFESALKRLLKSIECKGMLDPAHRPAQRQRFSRDLDRAIDGRRRARRRAVARALLVRRAGRPPRQPGRRAAGQPARAQRRFRLPARTTARSCSSFTETDLRAAHVVARGSPACSSTPCCAPDRDQAGRQPDRDAGDAASPPTPCSRCWRASPPRPVAAA